MIQSQSNITKARFESEIVMRMASEQGEVGTQPRDHEVGYIPPAQGQGSLANVWLFVFPSFYALAWQFSTDTDPSLSPGTTIQRTLHKHIVCLQFGGFETMLCVQVHFPFPLSTQDITSASISHG